jgi:hypothetical protein
MNDSGTSMVINFTKKFKSLINAFQELNHQSVGWGRWVNSLSLNEKCKKKVNGDPLDVFRSKFLAIFWVGIGNLRKNKIKAPRKFKNFIPSPVISPDLRVHQEQSRNSQFCTVPVLFLFQQIFKLFCSYSVLNHGTGTGTGTEQEQDRNRTESEEQGKH